MVFNAIIIFPIVFAVASITTYLLIPCVARFANYWGIVDEPGARHLRRAPVARLGGVAIFIAFHASCALIYSLHITPLFGLFRYENWISFFSASLILLIVGMFSDIRGLSKRTKIVGQCAVAMLLYSSGIHFGRIFGFDLPIALDVPLTVGWVVLLCNIFYIADGMDGLASGLALIASLGMAGSLLFRHQPGDALLLMAFFASLLVFASFNFEPASIFLGDCGSYFLGLALATLSLSTSSKGTLLAAIGMPLIAVGVPVFEALFVIKLYKRSTAHLSYIFSMLIVLGGLVSLALGAQAWGIFALGYMLAAYVVARHVAKVELWDSGVALVEGFNSPSSPLLATVLAPLVDFFLLSIALLITLLLSSAPGELHSAGFLLTLWFFSIPVCCGLPFIALFVCKTYSRVWGRARLGEFVLLGLSIALGTLSAWGLTKLGMPSALFLSPAVWVLFSLCAITLIVGLRAAPRAVLDLVTFAEHNFHSHDRTKPGAVVYGAGQRGVLYTDLMHINALRSGKPAPVIGFIDDDRQLRGRMVRSFPVLGGMRDLAALLKIGALREVILTAPLSDKRLARLRRLCRQSRVSLFEWRPQLRCLVAPSPDAGRPSLFDEAETASASLVIND